MNEINDHMTDDLLVKYVLGEATADEQQQVQNWIDAKPENAKQFEHFKLIWDNSKEIEAKSTVSADDAWGRFKQKVADEKAKPKTVQFKPNRTAWLKVAAVIILLVGGTWLGNLLLSTPKMLALQTTDDILSDTLTDGTVVTLNKNSKLVYPADFDGDLRSVDLQGEAFFDVAPDKSKPFVIHINEISVRVVGTSFNIKNTPTVTEVAVETGIVEVAKKQETIQVTPNEVATVYYDRATPVKQKLNDQLHNYYRTREFVCNGTPLWRLVDVLNEAYRVNIVIGDTRLKNLMLTTTFHDEPLDSILSVISQTFNIRVEKTPNQIVLR